MLCMHTAIVSQLEALHVYFIVSIVFVCLGYYMYAYCIVSQLEALHVCMHAVHPDVVH